MKNSHFKKAGKIIEPNHNDSMFDYQRSVEIASKLVSRIKSTREFVKSNPEKFLKPDISWNLLTQEEKRKHINDVLLVKFRLYRKKVISFILHCDLEAKKEKNYLYLKRMVEMYWDDPDNFIDFSL